MIRNCKKIILPAIAAVMALSSCQKVEGIEVEIKNPADIDRQGEMVEVPLNTVRERFADDNFAVYDAQGNKVVHQITSDNTVIFQCDVNANSKVVYKILANTEAQAEEAVDTVVCGKIYTNRQDDLSWENQVVGFRAYGPGTEQRGERLYGYDLWLKRNTNTAPIIEEMVNRNQNGETWALINELRKTDPQKADSLANATTYHKDQGKGMDCYAVGPTLGAATSAIMVNDSIVYPWCYKDAQILDNGPIRFKAKMWFAPQKINGESVTEVRVITLDASTNLNKTEVSFEGLSSPSTVVTGIVLHDDPSSTSFDNRYMSYIDPTQGSDNGQLYIGAVYPEPTESTQENRQLGHLLGVSSYNPGTTYVYYWGFGWDRGNMPSFDAWNQYLKDMVVRVDNPLEVKTRM